MTTPLTLESIRRAPKALLHDHLDGGLRPATVVELADANSYDHSCVAAIFVSSATAAQSS